MKRYSPRIQKEKKEHFRQRKLCEPKNWGCELAKCWTRESGSSCWNADMTGKEEGREVEGIERGEALDKKKEKLASIKQGLIH